MATVWQFVALHVLAVTTPSQQIWAFVSWMKCGSERLVLAQLLDQCHFLAPPCPGFGVHGPQAGLVSLTSVT